MLKKDQDFHIKNAERVAKLLDSQFGIGNFRFGLDPILGLIPGGGDTISLVLSSYILWIGWSVGVSKMRFVQMLGNLGIDFLIGLIPLVGDIFDFTIKANTKNLEIIKRHLGQIPEEGILEK